MTYVFNLFLILALMGASSCSQTKQRKVIVPQGEPEWLYSPQSACEEEKEICATGEGSSFSRSDAKAKKALASIFETSIESSFNFTKNTFSDSEISQMSEIIHSEVNENVAGILKASMIKERYKNKKLRFSLAAIDVTKSSKVLKQEISQIDNQINHFYKLKNRLYLKKLNVLLNQRNLLNEKYTIMTGQSITSPLDISSIEMLKVQSIGGQNLKLEFTDDTPSVISKKIEEIFSEIGYKISKGNYDYIVRIRYDSKPEYLNVKGFKKYHFELNIESRNDDGKKLGNYIISLDSSGRNEKDAYARIRKTIITEFESNLEKLNLN